MAMNYIVDETKIAKDIAQKLKDNLNGTLFRVETDIHSLGTLSKTVEGDIVVFDVDNRPVAVVEIKGFPQAWATRFKLYSSLSRSLNQHGVRYYIITDGNEFWIRSSEDTEFVLSDFDNVIKTIKEGLPSLGPVPSLDKIIEALKEAASKAKLKQVKAISRFIGKERTKPLFKTDATTGRIEFSTASAEDAFFSYLLNGKIPTKLCRFTTRHNLFLLLKDGKQNMCSIVCMNDKSEENYADDKVGYTRMQGSSLPENNNCFIVSLMPEEKADDLTMWRLYGDDAKGVCLNYEIENRQRGRRLKGDFYISSISYGVNEKSHPELDFLRNLLRVNIDHWHFHLNRWMIWKHFFKSFRFKDEKEVRLLYLSKDKSKEDKKWIENETSGIVSKMLLFQMNPTNAFPLRLCNVIVGPKAPEPTKIAEQFAFIVSQEWDNYSPIVIRESRIKEYR